MAINARNSPLFAVGQSKWLAFVTGYTGPYGLSGSVYAGMNRKVSFVCPTHGLQTMDAKVLMRGALCLLCAKAARVGKPRVTQKQVLERFATVHGDRFGYAYVRYRGAQKPVRIHCAKHGFFEQIAESHWSGSECPTCALAKKGASQRMTTGVFQDRLRSMFGGKLVFEGQEYVNSQSEIRLRCTVHNVEYPTRANWALNGCNPCTKCNHMQSKAEAAITKHVSVFTPVLSRDRTLLKPKELDMYMPEKALAVEYSGMYWHSHFTAEDELAGKRRHFDKYQECRAKGVRLLTVYESEWQQHEPAIRRLLRNAVGKSKGRLMARKCDLRKVPTADARVFYDKYHPQGGAGGGEHYGLFWKEKLVACMRFSFGNNDRGLGAETRGWTLGRYATRVTVAGAASRLFKAFVAAFDPAEVKSFSDNRYFSGDMYQQLGFFLDEELTPDYQVWSPKLGLRPKSHYQRRNIPKRLTEHGLDPASFVADTDTRTEAEMTYLMGCGRIYDCGKKRWVWRKKPLAFPPKT